MVFTLTVDEMLDLGIEYVGFHEAMRGRVKPQRNVTRFVDWYGSHPVVCVKIWHDLQTTDIPAARIELKSIADAKRFLFAMYYLRHYPKENAIHPKWKMCDKTARKVAWSFASRIQALKEEKIYWPDAWTKDSPNLDLDTFIISVDGTHFAINEPKHPTLPQDPKFFSHKIQHAALSYEIGIALFEDRVVWMSGPYPAGTPDIAIFRNGGLKDMIPGGKKAIADKGYRGEPKISIPNPEYPKFVTKFHTRARCRQESFNFRIKTFDVLKVQFRHGIDKHKIAFEAVCVIMQYQLESGSPLFTI